MREERLKHVAEVYVSNVDKKSEDGDLAVSLCNYTDVYYNERITGALDFMSATATRDQRTKFGLRKGDVVLTKDSETAEDIGVSALVAEDVPHLVCGYHLAVVRARAGAADGAYLRWVLASTAARQRMSAGATGVTRFGLRSDAIADLPVPLPPTSTQRAIADYLDRETARIDALIAAKQRMVELLVNKRRTILTHYVTRGCNPGASMADHGIAWIGQTPSHWRTAKFTRSVFIVEGQVDPEVEPYCNLSLIAPNHIESGTGTVLNHETALEQGAISGKYLCRPGDVIYSKIRPALRKATIASEQCLCSADMYSLRASPDLDAHYLLLLVLSEPFSTWAVMESERVAMPKINRDSLSDLRILLPPLDEQRQIVARVRAETEQIDQMRSVTERSVGLLQERRQALITVAVTGQLKSLEAA